MRSVSATRRLAWALAFAAIVVMLPALPTDLFVDDLIQRLVHLPSAELPPRILDSGCVPSGSGRLGTVLNGQFAYCAGEGAMEGVRDYGTFPWWAPERVQLVLWRPLTAFTHWLDYRLFPASIALMHAHNIGWYALTVFLVATVYRTIAAASTPIAAAPTAALAAGLFLLDSNTYLPVMYVANRGFFIALVFGLLCLLAHHRWRTANAHAFMWLSALAFLLSLLANEAGASTLAFLLAYALVLEPNGWRPRVRSLLPAAAVLLAWRAIYSGFGFGVKGVIGYIDPGYAPLLFLQLLAPRANGLLGGQLVGLPPEVSFALSPQARTALAALFAGFSLLCAAVFLPTLREDRTARFWATAMLLALVPAATVAPLAKNLGFVAVGAFGTIAAFLVRFGAAHERARLRRPLRALSWCIAVWLVIAHVPGALATRAVLALVAPSIPKAAAGWGSSNRLPEIGERNVVVVNDPTVLTAMVPFYLAYHRRPLPRTVNMLVPGNVPLEVHRPDASTLIITARGTDLFGCAPLGPFHVCYVCESVTSFLFGGAHWERGARIMRKHFVVEVLDVSERGAPRSVAFHFDRPLEADGTVWLSFDWRRESHAPFVLPTVGDTIEIGGPVTS